MKGWGLLSKQLEPAASLGISTWAAGRRHSLALLPLRRSNWGGSDLCHTDPSPSAPLYR